MSLIADDVDEEREAESCERFERAVQLIRECNSGIRVMPVPRTFTLEEYEHTPARDSLRRHDPYECMR